MGSFLGPPKCGMMVWPLCCCYFTEKHDDMHNTRWFGDVLWLVGLQHAVTLKVWRVGLCIVLLGQNLWLGGGTGAAFFKTRSKIWGPISGPGLVPVFGSLLSLA